MNNKEIAAQFFQEGYVRHHYEAVMELVSETYLDHSPAGARSNQDCVNILKCVERQLQGMKVEIRELFGEGDLVAARVCFEAVHAGEYMGIPATGKRIRFEALESFRMEKGKIVESWGYWPDKEIERQLLA